MEAEFPLPLSDFPEDVLLCVLSFLRPSDMAKFSVTCKRFAPLWHDRRLWYTMCYRRWGSQTLIAKWGGEGISYRCLYLALAEYENLIGFWRRYGDTSAALPAAASPLVFFEWGPSYITGSRVSPSKNRGYDVVRKPFLWMSLAPNGEAVNYLDPDGRSSPAEEILAGESESVENELIRVSVSFIGERHVMVEEENLELSDFERSPSLGSLGGEEIDSVHGCSPPDKMMTEIYQYFANRTSPSGNGVSRARRQRRREKEKQARRKKWDPEHFAKIVSCSPEPDQPLQGLWKGISDDMSLNFYLVFYDGSRGVSCRRVGDSNAPVFWMSNPTSTEPPFSPTEDYIYNCRTHPRPRSNGRIDESDTFSPENVEVSRILHINSSYDTGPAANPRLGVEGRLWVYENGSFGFGFLGDGYVVDLRPVVRNGHLLDAIEPGDG